MGAVHKIISSRRDHWLHDLRVSLAICSRQTLGDTRCRQLAFQRTVHGRGSRSIRTERTAACRICLANTYSCSGMSGGSKLVYSLRPTRDDVCGAHPCPGSPWSASMINFCIGLSERAHLVTCHNLAKASDGENQVVLSSNV